MFFTIFNTILFTEGFFTAIVDMKSFYTFIIAFAFIANACTFNRILDLAAVILMFAAIQIVTEFAIILIGVIAVDAIVEHAYAKFTFVRCNAIIRLASVRLFTATAMLCII